MGFEPPDLKPFPTEVLEATLSPACGAADVEVAIPQPTPSPESRPVSRVKAFFFTALYTLVFAITTSVVCLCGSVSIGFPYDERSAVYTRVTCASILSSVVLGPIYFTNRRFITSMKERNELVHVHIANGRLLKALGRSLLLLTVAIGVVATAATFGYGLSSGRSYIPTASPPRRCRSHPCRLPPWRAPMDPRSGRHGDVGPGQDTEDFYRP